MVDPRKGDVFADFPDERSIVEWGRQVVAGGNQEQAVRALFAMAVACDGPFADTNLNPMAIKYYTQVVEQDDGWRSVAAMVRLGHLQKEADPDLAVEWWRRAAGSAYPRFSYQAATDLGQHHRDNQDLDGGLAWLERASSLARAEEQPQSYVEVAWIQINRDPREAKRWVQRVIDQWHPGATPAWPEAAYLLASAHFKLDEPDLALEWYQAASNQGYSRGRLHLAQLAFKRGDVVGGLHWAAERNERLGRNDDYFDPPSDDAFGAIWPKARRHSGVEDPPLSDAVDIIFAWITDEVPPTSRAQAAADAAHVLSHVALPSDITRQAATRAAAYFEQHGADDAPAVMYRLGSCFFHLARIEKPKGNEEPDEALALARQAEHWLAEAARSTDQTIASRAMLQLSPLFADRGLLDDVDASRTWSERAAEVGTTEASLHAALQVAREADPSRRRDVTQPNEAAAIRWYNHVAESGHPELSPSAISCLGSYYADNRYTTRSFNQARRHWQQIIDSYPAKRAQAMLDLGLSFERDDPSDQASSVRWFSAAAEAGVEEEIIEAMIGLANVDPDHAIDYYSRALYEAANDKDWLSRSDERGMHVMSYLAGEVKTI